MLSSASHVFEFIFPQDYAAKAEEDISRLNKGVKTEHDARVTIEKKMEGTEQALLTLSQENAALQSKLEETQKKLEATETELASLKQMITQMLTTIVGKLNTCFFVLSHLFCFLLSVTVVILTPIFCL